jgi:hypothetical protein
LETVIALGVFLIFSLGVLFAWRYVAGASGNLLARQNAFENARAAIDAMVMNIQLADVIRLETGEDDMLRRLIMPGRDPQGVMRDYTFSFNAALNRLNFSGNEFASRIAMVRVVYVGQRMDITVVTDCDAPVVLEGSVDVRYKRVELLD